MIYAYTRILELKNPIGTCENCVELGKGMAKLNELGRAGWRLMSVETMETGIAYILERAIKEHKWETP